MDDEMSDAAKRVTQELRGRRAYPLIDLEEATTTEDPLWADLREVYAELSDEELETRHYKPRRLIFRRGERGAEVALEVQVPLEGATLEDLEYWLRQAGAASHRVHVEMRRVGGVYYGSRGFEVEDETPAAAQGPELLQADPQTAPQAAPQAPQAPQGGALVPRLTPSPASQLPPGSIGAGERLLLHVLSSEGIDWLQRLVALVAGSAVEMALEYRKRAAKGEETARLEAQLQHLQQHGEELRELKARAAELEALRLHVARLQREVESGYTLPQPAPASPQPSERAAVLFTPHGQPALAHTR